MLQGTDNIADFLKRDILYLISVYIRSGWFIVRYGKISYFRFEYVIFLFRKRMLIAAQPFQQGSYPYRGIEFGNFVFLLHIVPLCFQYDQCKRQYVTQLLKVSLGIAGLKSSMVLMASFNCSIVISFCLILHVLHVFRSLCRVRGC